MSTVHRDVALGQKRKRKKESQMKRFLFAAVLVIIAAPVLAANVGMSINVGQPGFYGPIDIGNYPTPQLIYRAPVIVQPVPMGMAAQPMYLRVPPNHRKNWRHHCRRYGACGQAGYFVRSDWYNNVYIPSYRANGHSHGYGRGGQNRNYYRNNGGGHDRRN